MNKIFHLGKKLVVVSPSTNSFYEQGKMYTVVKIDEKKQRLMAVNSDGKKCGWLNCSDATPVNELFEDLYQKIDLSSKEDIELLAECIQEEIDYLVAEGFGEITSDQCFRFFTDNEIQFQIDSIS